MNELRRNMPSRDANHTNGSFSIYNGYCIHVCERTTFICDEQNRSSSHTHTSTPQQVSVFEICLLSGRGREGSPGLRVGDSG